MLSTEPGDLILVRSTGKGYGVGRAATGNSHDHIAVVVHGGQSINIVFPAGRKIAAERLLQSRLQPIVLRPQWRSEKQRADFVAWMESLEAARYDVRRTLTLIPRLLAKHWLRIRWPFPPIEAQRDRWICTDAVFLGLEAEPAFKQAIRKLPLDWVELRCATTNDFLIVAETHPEVLKRI